MAKFIEIHDTIVNVNEIGTVRFLGDDIYLGLFPKGENGEPIADYIAFDFAKVTLIGGEEITMSIHLYYPEEGETEDDWVKRNRAYLNWSMTELTEQLNPTKVTNREYE